MAESESALPSFSKLGVSGAAQLNVRPGYSLTPL